ncbi:MAG: heavy metal translocating P-type ATPase, partial [Synergistaceae bacterium]|nr:heavy metal translocating P-type ATPase [Synergistaceae bacterium]
MDNHNNDNSGGGHHTMMVADFRKRFWISLAATVPVLILSPTIQSFFGMERAISFTGDLYMLWVISSFLFFYGGWPFLKGLYNELKKAEPGMMTLIAVAITTAYAYSSVV